jgi:hypothetical protein
MLGDASGELKLTVFDVTYRIIKCDKFLLYGLGKRASPYYGVYQTIESGHKMTPTHAHGCSVFGSQSIRFIFGYDLSNAG